ncbi:uncharacterized protein LOC120352353 [Nilaparvata lugens]|uniref:uncharacterized protein LOC120352353 n=1 Tax=Nilaparvata lugens TaxID=108931 RepID=UPI00193DD42C|nr:uncharacterized protein LOC120352353 [Nilaparvata lugens]
MSISERSVVDSAVQTDSDALEENSCGDLADNNSQDSPDFVSMSNHINSIDYYKQQSEKLKSDVEELTAVNSSLNEELLKLNKTVDSLLRVDKENDDLKLKLKLLVDRKNDHFSSSDKWVEDHIIADYFSSFNNSVGSNLNCLFFSPAITQLLKAGTEESVKDTILNSSYADCKFVFLCVNNGDNVERPDDGNHWSLLFIHRECHTHTAKAYHFDSILGINNKSALKIVNNLNISESCYMEVPCIQQRNGYECGINVLINAKFILNYYCVPGIDEPFSDWYIESMKNINVNKQSAGAALLTPPSSSPVPSPSLTPNFAPAPSDSLIHSPYSVENMRSNSSKSLLKHPKNFKSSTSLGKSNCKVHFKNTRKPRNSDLETSSHSKHSDSGSKIRVHHYADSQGRDVCKFIRNNNNYRFTSFVKPGAKFQDVLPDDLENFGERDFLVIQAGSNDISKNEAKDVLVAVRRNLAALYKTNVFVFSIPHRYDLADWSCVNVAIEETNREIMRICNLFSHVKFIDIGKIGRRFFTSHGMHLNGFGKKYVSDRISKSLESHLSDSNSFSPISLPYGPFLEEKMGSHPSQTVDLMV